MLDAVLFEHAPDLDRPARRKAAVGIDEQRHIVAQRLADRRDDLLGPARPLVDVVAIFRGDAELEGVEAEFAPEPLEALGLGRRRDVALHRGGVGAQRPRRAAKQADDRQAGFLAAAIPDSGIEAAERPLHVGAGKFVLALDHLVGQRVDVVELHAKHPGRNLPVQHGGGDVGIVGRDLPDAGGAGVRRYAHEADEFGRKCFDAVDAHRASAASIP